MPGTFQRLYALLVNDRIVREYWEDFLRMDLQDVIGGPHEFQVRFLRPYDVGLTLWFKRHRGVWGLQVSLRRRVPGSKVKTVRGHRALENPVALFLSIETAMRMRREIDGALGAVR